MTPLQAELCIRILIMRSECAPFPVQTFRGLLVKALPDTNGAQQRPLPSLRSALYANFSKTNARSCLPRFAPQVEKRRLIFRGLTLVLGL